MKSLFGAIPLILLLVGCIDDSDQSKSAKAESKTVEAQQGHFLKTQPVPFFDWSLDRDVYIQLYEARNQNIATYAVFRSALGTIEDHCPSIGFPLPADVSLTNPVRAVEVPTAGSGANPAVAIEQAEPNGLYSSRNTYATWVRCVVEFNGIPMEVPIYVESNVTAYPFFVEVDQETNRVTWITDTDPTLTIKDNSGQASPTTDKPIPTPTAN